MGGGENGRREEWEEERMGEGRMRRGENGKRGNGAG
jgi:hypothetical protein